MNAHNVKGELHVEIPVDTVHDLLLTNAELGFLVRLLDKPETWEYRPKEIAEEFRLSLSSVHRMFDALIRKQYILRLQTRVHDLATGRWSRSCDYTVFASLKLRLEDGRASRTSKVTLGEYPRDPKPDVRDQIPRLIQKAGEGELDSGPAREPGEAAS